MSDQHRRVRAAAITGIGQLLGLLGSTLIGVLVAGTLPPSPRVDAFFGANQVYALALYLGQAVRITAPALLVRSGLEPPRLRMATAWLALGTVAFMVAAALVGSGLVSPAARDDFTRDLLVLAPAAGIHVAAGGLAARMAVVGSFGWAAGAYAAGSVTSGILLLLVIDSQGEAALAPCIALGAVTIGVIMLLGYQQVAGTSWTRLPVRGYASDTPVDPDAVVGPGPDRSELPYRPTATFASRRILLGAVPALALQLLITVATVAAGHIEEGGTALLSYSFLALFAFTTISITPMSIVLGPEVAEHWDGAVDSLASIVRQATRLAIVVVVPLIVLGFLVGRPLAGILLPALTDADLNAVFGMLAILCPPLLLTAAATAATVGITAADRLGRLAAGLATTGAMSIFAAIVLVELGVSLYVIAASAAIFSLAYSVVTLQVALGREAYPTVLAILADNLAVLAPPLLATAILAPLLTTNLAIGCLVSIPVILLHGVVVLALRRETVDLLVGAARKRVA